MLCNYKSIDSSVDDEKSTAPDSDNSAKEGTKEESDVAVDADEVTEPIEVSSETPRGLGKSLINPQTR